MLEVGAKAPDFTLKNKDGNDAIRSFCSRDYENADFEVLVETVSGVNASVAGDISMLDTVLKHGSISLESYISAYPDDALTDKQKILELVRAERAREDSSLQAQVDSLSKQLERATETIKEQEATVSRVVSVINENRTLKQFISKEFVDGK